MLDKNKIMVRLWYDGEEENVDDKIKKLITVSNPKKVVQNAQYYFNDPNIKVYLSPIKNKKYAIYDPINKKLVSFGSLNHEDYTYHQNDIRRNNYIKRASNIKGNWRNNPYSPNNLSLNLLWG